MVVIKKGYGTQGGVSPRKLETLSLLQEQEPAQKNGLPAPTWVAVCVWGNPRIAYDARMQFPIQWRAPYMAVRKNHHQ